MKKLLIFDVCNTIVNTNSTNEYINFLIEHNLWNKLYKNLLKNKYVLILFYFIHKYTHYNIHRKAIFKFFKWIKLDDVEKINYKFLKLYLSKKTKVMDILTKTKNINETDIFLISASINQPIDLLSEYLWVKSFSTKMTIKNKKYTGWVEHDLLWNKEFIIKKWAINLKKYHECNIYTDNTSDFNFIKYLNQSSIKSLKVYPVIKNNEQKKKRENFLFNNKVKHEFIY